MPRKKVEVVDETKNIALALKALCEDKGLPTNVVIEAMSEALKKAYFKFSGDYPDTIIKVDIDLNSGNIKMAKIKNVVKVMNFQALLRMDKALKQADKYKDVGKEITDILGRILYNKNLILDKKILTPEQDKPELNIYIANDYGFCGNFNSEVSRRIKKDVDAYKIIIGKKIVFSDDKTLLKINKDGSLELME